MDNRAKVGEFLTSRRVKITPGQAGVPQFNHRDTSLAGALAGVLDAIARALHMDEAERAYLFQMASP